MNELKTSPFFEGKTIIKQAVLKDDESIHNPSAKAFNRDIQINLLPNTFKLENKIGNGGFASVYKYIYQRDLSLAIKVFDNSKDNGINDCFNKEKDVLEKVGESNNPNIIKYYCHYSAGPDNRLALVFELADMDMLKFMDKYAGKMSVEHFHNLLAQLLEIVVFLNEKKVINNDIGYNNLVYSASTDKIKMIDFGVAKELSNSNRWRDFSKSIQLSYNAQIRIKYHDNYCAFSRIMMLFDTGKPPEIPLSDLLKDPEMSLENLCELAEKLTRYSIETKYYSCHAYTDEETKSVLLERNSITPTRPLNELMNL